MRFFLISDNNDTRLGMRLTGIEGVVVHEPDEVNRALSDAMQQEDIAVIRDRDPAASSALEVMLLYNGFKAVRAHRRANWFYRHGMHFLAP